MSTPSLRSEKLDLPHEISRAEQRRQLASSSFRPSLPPDPLTPRRPSPF
jgi:hypothetical protein